MTVNVADVDPAKIDIADKDLSTATGIFYRQALRCHGLPFEVKVDEPNAVTYAAMEAAEKGEDMYGPFDSVADLMEALNA